VKNDLAGLVVTLRKSRPPAIVVIGDLILDRWIWGDVERISPEAPVPVLELTSETFSPGGAANVAANLAAMGAEVHVVGLVGPDTERDRLLGLLEEARIGRAGVLEDPCRPTTSKTRVIGHNQQIVRIDREKRSSMPAELLARARVHLEQVAPAAAAIVVSDYAKGVITEPLLDGLRAIVRARSPLPVVVDPKSSQVSIYRDFTVLTPNLGEAATGAGFKIKDEASLVEAGYKLRSCLNVEAVLITRGPQGMSLFERGREPLHIPSVVRNVYDVTGAGDTVTSMLALAIACGLDLPQAAHLANHAASVVVGKFGTATVKLDELEALAAQEP
jgi:D-beta-D-heptose 7-phosphate kinase/D-beta-D-heptose 1-phosphate adenosyltransferase